MYLTNKQHRSRELFEPEEKLHDGASPKPVFGILGILAKRVFFQI